MQESRVENSLSLGLWGPRVEGAEGSRYFISRVHALSPATSQNRIGFGTRAVTVADGHLLKLRGSIMVPCCIDQEDIDQITEMTGLNG